MQRGDRMDDLISRQAATQTALEFIVEYLGGAFDEDLQKKLMERMNALPPEVQEYEYDYATLVDWYINSVDDSEPVWTEEHLEELYGDFHLIPRKR